MRKLLITSGSMNVRREPVEPVPALDRFDGIFIKQIRKYHEKLRKVDVLILSPVYGLVRAEDKIVYNDSVVARGASWGSLEMSHQDILRTRESNLVELQSLLKKRKYDEVYVNVGKNMLKLIEGFERMLQDNIKITYSRGNGIGPKMRHMKDWIESLSISGSSQNLEF